MRRPAYAADTILAVCVSVAVVYPGDAHACDISGPVPHVIDTALVGVDQTSPTLPQPTVALIRRDDAIGCMGVSSCGDLTAVNITNLATDDMTPANKIGYRFAVTTGALPDSFILPKGVVDWANHDASLWLVWGGNSDDFDFTLALVAVDAAGNESTARTVRIHDNSEGCSIGHRNAVSGYTAAVVALALAAAARRSRRRISFTCRCDQR